MTPKVSILLPVYNGEDTILRCLQSIYTQTYTNLEIIVINDGSTDRTLEILKQYRESDKRTIIIDKENEGLIKTLNLGIERATGEFIARIDADDICFNERIEKQVRYMTDNPSIGLLGTAVETFGKRETLVRYLTDPKQLKISLFFQNDFAHPSVMIRRSILLISDLKYEEQYLHVEDYGLWSKLARHAEIANLGEPLLYYQLSTTSVSAKATEKREERDLMHCRIYEDNFRSIHMPYTVYELRIHRAISINSPYYFSTKGSLSQMKRWINKVEQHLLMSGTGDKSVVESVMARQYYIAYNKFTSLGLSVFLDYISSKYGRKSSFKALSKFFVKCLIAYKPKKTVRFEETVCEK